MACSFLSCFGKQNRRSFAFSALKAEMRSLSWDRIADLLLDIDRHPVLVCKIPPPLVWPYGMPPSLPARDPSWVKRYGCWERNLSRTATGSEKVSFCWDFKRWALCVLLVSGLEMTNISQQRKVFLKLLEVATARASTTPGIPPWRNQ